MNFYFFKVLILMDEKNQLLANVVESSDDAIITKSLNGSITSWNKGAELIYGYSAEEVIGKNISILAPLPLKDEVKQLIEKIENGEKIVHFETVRIHKDGQKLDVSVSLSPIYDVSGKLIGISTITRDITNNKKLESDLKESEEKFREVFNNANDAMFLHKLYGRNPGKFIEVNDVACQILGYSRNELLNMSPRDIDTSETVAQIPLVIENLLNKGKTTFEAVQLSKDGELLPVEINTHLFTIRGEKYILSISRDIRERKKAEDALKKSENKYRTIFENVQDIFYQTNLEGNIIEISPSIERYSGYKPAELIGKPVETVYLNPEDREYLIKKIVEEGEVVDYEVKLKTKTNKLLYVSTNAHILFDSSKNPIGIEGSLRDITERKNIEIQLKKSLEEKEMLLKEIHHRVKNNLMIISSLLNLQSRYIKDKASQDIFKESQNRARSMALIHERLYQATDLKRIDFGEYISELATELFHTYVSDHGLIELKINVEDIFLDINTAIPLGLIVNELITNSLKHAFPDGNNGEINVEFRQLDNHYEFTVRDNGIGFPKDIDFENSDSLGLRIVSSLTDQIDGHIELNRNNGTEFRIIFKELEL
jgi:PAS domain S-box-containing protein